jgi:hypothetical protein
MENVLPKCECGQDVRVHMYQVPHYDDGGGLETVEQEYVFDDQCEDCVYSMAEDIEFVDEDELPF